MCHFYIFLFFHLFFKHLRSINTLKKLLGSGPDRWSPLSLCVSSGWEHVDLLCSQDMEVQEIKAWTGTSAAVPHPAARQGGLSGPSRETCFQLVNFSLSCGGKSRNISV